MEDIWRVQGNFFSDRPNRPLHGAFSVMFFFYQSLYLFMGEFSAYCFFLVLSFVNFWHVKCLLKNSFLWMILGEVWVILLFRQAHSAAAWHFQCNVLLQPISLLFYRRVQCICLLLTALFSQFLHVQCERLLKDRFLWMILCKFRVIFFRPTLRLLHGTLSVICLFYRSLYLQCNVIFFKEKTHLRNLGLEFTR